MSREFEDKILLYQAKVKQDPEAYGKLYDVYVKRIYRFVYFKVGGREEAEDITSEVFLKAWNYLRENNDVKSFSGLLYRIARNCVIDLYRSKTTQPDSLENFTDQDAEIGDGGKWLSDMANKAEAGEILKALKNLKQEYREILTLRYVEDLSANEIAEIVGKGSIAVRVTLHRALKKLKEILGNGN